MPRLLTQLNEIFSKQPFLLGDEFTVADVAVVSILNYIPIILKVCRDALAQRDEVQFGVSTWIAETLNYESINDSL